MGAFARREKQGLDEDIERVYAWFPRLRERSQQPGGLLSGGEQQMLAIGRALMARPTVLLLDEPSLGLSPLLVEEMFALVRRLNEEGLAILLVEQNVVQSLALANRAYVMENGRIVLSGSATDLADDPQLRKAYLGM
jgi:branched-chain amino acid transport system ATP-binding protein